MKAEEIVKKIKQGSPFSGGFDDWEAEAMIKDYAREKLHVQRGICAEVAKVDMPSHPHLHGSSNVNKSEILDADEPELE